MAGVALVSMCKDEIDIAGPMLRHMATQVDFMLVADNNSTDGTRDLLSDLSHELPLTVIADPDPAYYQSAKMTRLAHLAGEKGPEWIVPGDFDEIWYPLDGTRLGDVLDKVAPGTTVATADLFDHVTSSWDDLSVADPVARIGWRRILPAPLTKVAARWSPNLVIEQGNHGASHGRRTRVAADGLLAIRHFPWRSREQFVRKSANGAAAYAATSLPDDLGAHWRGYGRILDSEGPAALWEVYQTWFHLEDPERNPSVIFDPAPRA